VPELAEPRRVSWPTLAMLAGTLAGGWALIGVLLDVSRSFDTVIGADRLWVALAFVLAQLVYVASAVETTGSALAGGRRCSPPGCASSSGRATTPRWR
jgi:hypothetical protein